MIPVSIVFYWMMILWLKQSDTWKLKQSDTCVNSGLLKYDILIKANVSIVVDDILIKINVSMIEWW